MIRSYPKKGVPEYPVTGVNFYYYLNEKVKDAISLDILDEDGKVIRSFTNRVKASKDKMPSEPDMATGFVQRGYSSYLSNKAGLHAFQWDFRHAGTWSKSGYSRSGSSKVAPGKYSLRLQLGNEQIEEPFELMIDPRLIVAGINVEDLKAQEALALRVRNLMSRARQLDAAIDAGMKKEEQRAGLQKLANAMNTADGRYQQPQLLAQISYLSSMLSYADQRPGKDAYDRYEELRKWFEELLGRWAEESGESVTRFKLDD